MTIIAIIISALALVLAVIGVVFAYRIGNERHVTSDKDEATTIVNPFIYDPAADTFTLHGNLYVNGFVTCTDKND